jgi:hypothetical protein
MTRSRGANYLDGSQWIHWGVIHMATNFHFLNPQWPQLAEAAAKVEVFAGSDARTACFWARRALELAVAWLFDFDPAFQAVRPEPGGAAGRAVI